MIEGRLALITMGTKRRRKPARGTKKSLEKTLGLLRNPEQLPPLNVEEFLFALNLGSAAYSLRMPMKSPAEEGLTLRDQDGRLTRISVTDIPFNRATIAVRDHFAPHWQKFTSFMMRFSALQALCDVPEMEEWVTQSPGPDPQLVVHGAVLRVAATLPLTAGALFDKESFFRTVRDLAQENRDVKAEQNAPPDGGDAAIQANTSALFPRRG